MKRELGPELPSELRAELARSRQAGHDYDVALKLPLLRAALDAAAHAPADGPSASHAPGTGALHVAPAAWKVVLLVAGASAAGFGAWSLQQHAQPPAPERTAISAQHVESAPPAPPVVPQAAPPPAPSAQPAPAHEVIAPAPAAEPSAQPAVRSSRREIAQLVRIRALLERDPAAAYRLALLSEREFPNGVLSEERQALQVLALTKSGSIDEAQRKANAFFARYPQSPMRDLIEAGLRR